MEEGKKAKTLSIGMKGGQDRSRLLNRIFPSPVSSLSQCSDSQSWSPAQSDSYNTNLKDPTYRVSLAHALEK